jgi:hypothetical protein
VIAETDLSITGRQAQFGRGIMQDVAGRMLDDFAKRFEAYLLEGADAGAEAADGSAAGPAAAPAPSSASDGEEALDVGSVLFRIPAVQRAGVAVVVGLLIALLLARRSRSG